MHLINRDVNMQASNNLAKQKGEARVENFRNIAVIRSDAGYQESLAFALGQGGKLFKRREIPIAFAADSELLCRLEGCSFWLHDQTCLYIPIANGLLLDEDTRALGPLNYVRNGIASHIVFKNSKYEPDIVRVIPAELRKEAREELEWLRRLGGVDPKIKALTKIVEGNES
jgi:hypothetical protein